jgi:hypothetical protein
MKTCGSTHLKISEKLTKYPTQHRSPTMREFWVEGHRFLWNHYQTEGPRTTNHLEGWHNKIKKKVHRAHPNIYLIIEVLQNTQTVTECTIIQYAAGGARPPKRHRYIVIDTRLQLLKERYQQRLINVVDYADAASHLLHLD